MSRHSAPGTDGAYGDETWLPGGSSGSVNAWVIGVEAKVAAAAPQELTRTPTKVGGEAFPVPSLTVTFVAGCPASVAGRQKYEAVFPLA